MKSAEFLVQWVRFRLCTTSRFVRLALSTSRHSAAFRVTQVERNTCVFQHHIRCSSLQRVHLSASEFRGSAVVDQTRRCASFTNKTLLISSVHRCESCRSKFVFSIVRLDIITYILGIHCTFFFQYKIHFSPNILRKLFFFLNFNNSLNSRWLVLLKYS